MTCKILIVEDEALIAETARLMINEFPNYEVEEIVHSVENALNFLQEKTVDLILLDIDLGAGPDGIELAEKLMEMEIPFLFFTSHSDQKTLSRAMEHSPLGYIVKPINRPRLLSALELATSQIKKEKTITIEDGSKVLKLKTKSILFLKAEGNYTEVFSMKKRYVVRKSLKQMIELLPEEFLQIHRAYVVNLKHILTFGSSVTISTDVVLPVSRTYKSTLAEKMKN